jgi:uncharacterized protein (TIGR02246 family)
MNADETQIRNVIATWHRATAEGDVDTILTLMSRDVIFLVAGQPPMKGRAAFGKGLRGLLKTHRIVSTGKVRECVVSGTLAFCRTELDVRITALAGGKAMKRAGTALSIFQKQKDGAWVLIRDANLMPPPR